MPFVRESNGQSCSFYSHASSCTTSKCCVPIYTTRLDVIAFHTRCPEAIARGIFRQIIEVSVSGGEIFFKEWKICALHLYDIWLLTNQMVLLIVGFNTCPTHGHLSLCHLVGKYYPDDRWSGNADEFWSLLTCSIHKSKQEQCKQQRRSWNQPSLHSPCCLVLQACLVTGACLRILAMHMVGAPSLYVWFWYHWYWVYTKAYRSFFLPAPCASLLVYPM